MGMFDTVIVECPCGEEVDFQSKAGDRSLKTYSVFGVPDAIAQDLNNETQTCPVCGTRITLKDPNYNTRITRMVVEYDQSDVYA